VRLEAACWANDAPFIRSHRKPTCSHIPRESKEQRLGSRKSHLAKFLEGVTVEKKPLDREVQQDVSGLPHHPRSSDALVTLLAFMETHKGILRLAFGSVAILICIWLGANPVSYSRQEPPRMAVGPRATDGHVPTYEEGKADGRKAGEEAGLDLPVAAVEKTARDIVTSSGLDGSDYGRGLIDGSLERWKERKKAERRPLPRRPKPINPPANVTPSAEASAPKKTIVPSLGDEPSYPTHHP